MNDHHFQYMQQAIEAESKSNHNTHKVGALICGTDTNAHKYEVARSNFWPIELVENIGKDQKLGNASTTVHAEIAAILSAPSTEGADIYITDLPCPNCSKAMAEARIGKIFINAEAFNTELGRKMEPFFNDVSTIIFKSAGISVFEINMKEKYVNQIVSPSPNKLISIHRPLCMLEINSSQINKNGFASLTEKHKSDTAFASCYAKNELGQYSFISAASHRSIGLNTQESEEISNIQDKYKSSLQPINRLLLSCARYGLKIDKDYLYSSQTPTSREFVNLIGAGYTSLTIGDRTKYRDKYGLKALEQLEGCGVISAMAKNNHSRKS